MASLLAQKSFMAEMPDHVDDMLCTLKLINRTS